jgi:hypothetical protein
MRGWRSYFGFCETPEVLIGLTRWVQLRLRRDRPAMRLVAGAALGASHGPRPLLLVFRIPTSDRSGSRHYSRSVSVTDSNRRVRTRTHGGVAGVGG